MDRGLGSGLSCFILLYLGGHLILNYLGLPADENWTIKKAEHRRIDAFEQTLESPLDCKEIQPVHPKGDQS